MDTATLPPMIATRPSVCMVVCIGLRSAAPKGGRRCPKRGTRLDGHRIGHNICST